MVASIGAGGVLYLTPMVFHNDAFTASQVGLGLALGAVAGTLGRFASGALLDRGLRCSLPVLLAALLAMGADLLLFAAHQFGGYLLGQLLFGAAVGLYWPAMELAVSLSCQPLPSARGYALARSADALGIALGALIGAGLAATGHLRGIYLVDISGLVLVVALLLRRPLAARAPLAPDGRQSDWHRWLPPLLPMLALTVVATAIPALMQSALPLDLVRGGPATASPSRRHRRPVDRRPAGLAAADPVARGPVPGQAAGETGAHDQPAELLPGLRPVGPLGLELGRGGSGGPGPAACGPR